MGKPATTAVQVECGDLKLAGLQEVRRQFSLTICAPSACFAETTAVAERTMNHNTGALTSHVRSLPAAAFSQRYRSQPEMADALCRKFAAVMGLQLAALEPARCNRASFTASRRSVLIRSPGRRGINDGATTAELYPAAATCR